MFGSEPVSLRTVTRWSALQAQPRDVVRVQQDHVAAVLAAVEVVVLVDDRVELPFAADGHQPQLAVAAVPAPAARGRAGWRGRWAWGTAAAWNVRPAI